MHIPFTSSTHWHCFNGLYIYIALEYDYIPVLYIFSAKVCISWGRKAPTDRLFQWIIYFLICFFFIGCWLPAKWPASHNHLLYIHPYPFHYIFLPHQPTDPISESMRPRFGYINTRHYTLTDGKEHINFQFFKRKTTIFYDSFLLYIW